MKTKLNRTQLTLGNHLYLYRVLKNAIGCGKQVLLPVAEEALAAQGMSAEALGFESTRALMEDLSDCVALTVFKGGRIYATVQAMPEWDAALDAPAKSDSAKPAKSFKKKKTDKTLKAVRPKTIQPKAEPEPEPEAMAEAEAKAEAAPKPEASTEQEPQAKAAIEPQAKPEADAEAMPDPEPENAPETEAETAPEPEPETTPQDETAAKPEPEPATPDKAEPAAVPEPKPAVKLTVVYNPDDAGAGAQTLESTPGIAPAKANDVAPETQEPSQEEPAAQEQEQQPKQTERPAHKKPAAQQAAPKPAAPEGPKDFYREVFCPGELLYKLGTLLPFGADALGIAGEYCWIAREKGELKATRDSLSFPMRYTQNGARKSAQIELRRNQNERGQAWVVSKVEAE